MPRLSLVIVLVTSTVSAAARAQTSASARPATVTIAQAIDEAFEHNLTLMAERSNLTVAEAAMLAARLRPNPVASISADHLDLLGTGFDAVNNGGPTELAVRVDLPIERGSKRERRVELASFEKQLAEAQFADAVRSLRLDVTLACVDVLAARATHALLADNLRAFQALADVNRVRVVAGAIAPYTYRAGGTTLLELLDAQRAFNDTMQSYLDAQANLRRAATRLNAAVGTEVVK